MQQNARSVSISEALENISTAQELIQSINRKWEKHAELWSQEKEPNKSECEKLVASIIKRVYILFEILDELGEEHDETVV